MLSKKKTLPPRRLSNIPPHSIQYVRGKPSQPTRPRVSAPVSFAGATLACSSSVVGVAPDVPLGRWFWLIVVSGAEAEDREPPSATRGLQPGSSRRRRSFRRVGPRRGCPYGRPTTSGTNGERASSREAQSKRAPEILSTV